MSLLMTRNPSSGPPPPPLHAHHRAFPPGFPGSYSLNNVREGREQGLGLILDAVLGTQRLYQGCHLVVVVSRHGGEEVVFNLEIEVATEPVVEG